MKDGTVRTVTAMGVNAGEVGERLVRELAGNDLRLVLVFADWRIDPAQLARTMQHALRPAPVVGCTAIGVIGDPVPRDQPVARALGLYGDWLRVGIGVAPDLPSSPLARARDAVRRAAAMLGTTPDRLRPGRHVAFSLVDGSCGHEEAFCIASAAAAHDIPFIGGSASTEQMTDRKSVVWAGGEALSDAGVVVVLESSRPLAVITSAHLEPTGLRTVVTASRGRVIEELDGQPAGARVRALVAQLGGTLDADWPSQYSFARFVDGVPYVRVIRQIEGPRIHMATAVELGDVLRLMRPGDLIARTRDDLAAAARQVGGDIAGLIAFSCIARHWEAAALGRERELAELYASYPTVGLQSAGEQTGMLLVNHTLTALAIGPEAPS
jgi:hypothetical protein